MCFTLGWIEQLLIWVVIIACVVGVLRLLVPWVLGLAGVGAGPIPQIINIIVTAIIVVAAIILVLRHQLSCVVGAGVPRLHG